MNAECVETLSLLPFSVTPIIVFVSQTNNNNFLRLPDLEQRLVVLALELLLHIVDKRHEGQQADLYGEERTNASSTVVHVDVGVAGIGDVRLESVDRALF